MAKPMASIDSTILRKAKENDHVPGVVAEIEVEISHSTEFQEIEKSTSNSLALESPTQHEQPVEVIEVGSMLNSLPHKVRKKAAVTEDIRTQVQSKCELKNDTTNLCQKITVEQSDLSRGFKDTTLSPEKFTPIPENFI